MKNVMRHLLTSQCVAQGGGQGLHEGKKTLLFSVVTLHHSKHYIHMSATGRILFHIKKVLLSLKYVLKAQELKKNQNETMYLSL